MSAQSAPWHDNDSTGKDPNMPTVQGRVATDRAGRYLDQLCGHLGQMQHIRHGPARRHGERGTGRDGDDDTAQHGGAGMPNVLGVERADGHGVVRFTDGAWTLTAAPGALLLRVEAADEQALDRLRGAITTRVEKIGRRDRLTVSWQQPEA